MKTLSIVLILLSLTCAANVSAADGSTTQQAGAQSATSIPAKDVLESIRMDKKYEDLSPEEKIRVRSMYNNLNADDEPPFPADGLKAIFYKIHRAENRLDFHGQFSADVLIDENGEPQTVSVFADVNPELTKYTTYLLMTTKFKPAKCQGTPCKMAFRLDYEFGRINRLGNR